MSQTNLSLSFKSQKTLKSLYLVYILAQNLNDTVHQLKSQENSQPFWSTSFIQAYFACNMLSEYNWHTLLDTEELEPWSAEAAETLSPADTLRDMVKFCYDSMGDQTPVIFDDILAGRLSNMKDPCIILSTRNPSVSNEIFQDNFQERFRKLIQHGTRDRDEHMLLVYKLLRFIYSVRDNLFQGLSLISAPMDEVMPERFEIYSEVLLASCELLFHTVEQCSDWQHLEVQLFNQAGNPYISKTIEESKLRNTGRSSILGWKSRSSF